MSPGNLFISCDVVYVVSFIPSHLVYLICPLRWRHDGRDSVSNHQPHDCLLSRLFRLRSKKTSKLRGTGLCAGNSPGPVNSPRKGPVTRKRFPFDDVVMISSHLAAHVPRLVLEVLRVHGTQGIQADLKHTFAFQRFAPMTVIINNYRKTSDISRTLESHAIVDLSDVAGAWPVGAAPAASWLSWL